MTGSIPDGMKGAPYSFTLSAQGGQPPYGWRPAAGRLPAGLSLNIVAGALTGIPASAGTASFTIELFDSNKPPQTARKDFSMQIRDRSLFISTPDLPGGRTGEAYLAGIQAKLGQPPYRWEIVSGVLPAGLRPKPSSTSLLTIGGKPAKVDVAGSRFVVEVRDSSVPVQSARQEYVIKVFDVVKIETKGLKCAYRGQSYSDFIDASGGEWPYTWSIVKDRLPVGLTLNSTTGHISGKTDIAKGRSVGFRVRVEDSGGTESFDERDLAILVVDPLAVDTTTTSRKAKTGSQLKWELKARGGVPPYKWLLEGGRLPSGVTLDKSGLVSGIPEEQGLFSFRVKVQDSPPAPNPANSSTAAFKLEVVR